MNPANRPYRDGVLGVFVRDDGDVLVFERSDIKGQYQFPQGGLDAGEDIVSCLKREIFEETGCADFKIISQTKDPIYYDFPSTLKSKITKKYCGQRQWWFRLSLDEGAAPDLSKATDDEFVSFKWCSPAEAIAAIADWRKDSYRDGLSQLGIWSQKP